MAQIEPESASLGTTAKFAVLSPQNDSQQRISHRLDTQETIFRILSGFKKQPKLKPGQHSGSVQFVDYQYRVCDCCRTLAPGQTHVGITAGKESGQAGFTGLLRCGQVWLCPVCASRITESRRAELLQIATYFHSKNKTLGMITLTARHNKGTRLNALIGQPKRKGTKATGLRYARALFFEGIAFRQLCEDFEARRIAYAWEVTRQPPGSGDKGFHAHTHELFVFDSRMTMGAFETRVKEIWLQCLTSAGLSGNFEYAASVDFGSAAIFEYIAKFGHEPKNKAWDITREISKGTAKRGDDKKGLTPFQWVEMYEAWRVAQENPEDNPEIDESWKDCRQWFAEYAEAVAGLKMLRYAPGVKDEAGIVDLSDEELAELDTEARKLVCRIPKSIWRAIKVTNRRPKLLELVQRTHDLRLIAEFLNDTVMLAIKVNEYFQPIESEAPDGSLFLIGVIGCDLAKLAKLIEPPNEAEAQPDPAAQPGHPERWPRPVTIPTRQKPAKRPIDPALRPVTIPARQKPVKRPGAPLPLPIIKPKPTRRLAG